MAAPVVAQLRPPDGRRRRGHAAERKDAGGEDSGCPAPPADDGFPSGEALACQR
jgi:hypothetical protein